MTFRLSSPANGPSWLPGFARSILDALNMTRTLDSTTVADLPDVPAAGGLIFVSDEAGGAVVAFSDGTNWRRVTDRAVVS